jgi:hypothetical protein
MAQIALTAVGGSFRRGLQREGSRLRPRIPPTAVGWIVQVLPTLDNSHPIPDFVLSLRVRQLCLAAACRQGLNNPATPAGGI